MPRIAWLGLQGLRFAKQVGHARIVWAIDFWPVDTRTADRCRRNLTHIRILQTIISTIHLIGPIRARMVDPCIYVVLCSPC